MATSRERLLHDQTFPEQKSKGSSSLQLKSDASTDAKDEKKHHHIHKEKQAHITLIGDSTIDNRVWVDGLVKSYIYTRLGIKRDEAQVRVQKSHRAIGKPNLSVVEHVMDMLPNALIHDYTNDGFTTSQERQSFWERYIFIIF